MADDLMATNPYLSLPEAPDKWSMLANLLIGAGAGISQAGASGRGWATGLAPGLMMGTQMNARDAATDFQRRLGLANWQTQESYRKSQEERLRAEADLKREELDLDKQAIGLFKGMQVPGTATASTPGFNVQLPAVQMGPSQFNVGNVRPVGSNVGFQQPASFDDGVALSVCNAQAYPKAFNNGQSMTLMQIGEKWAPQGDGNNDPKAWAFNVGRIGGLDPNAPLDFNNPEVAARFARGVHGAEWGGSMVKPPEAYMPGVQLAMQPGAPRVGGYQPVQFSQPSGNPTVNPSGLPGNVQPPRVDPMQFAPLMISKRLAPYGKAMIDIGNSETQRYLQDQDREMRRQQEAEKQRLAEQNAKVSPTGTPNKPLIDAEAQAAAQAEARRKAELDYEAATQVAKDEVARHSKDVRPGAEATANGLPNLYEMKRLLDSNTGVSAGSFIDARQMGARLLDTLGLRDMPDSMINRTEFNNRAGKNVLAILQTRALGAGTGISEGDRKFVEKMAASGGDFTDEELKRLIGIGIKSSHTGLEQHSQAVARLTKLPGMGKIDKGYFDLPAPTYEEWSKANADGPEPSQSVRPEVWRGLGGEGAGQMTNPFDQFDAPDLSAAAGRASAERSGDPRFAPAPTANPFDRFAAPVARSEDPTRIAISVPQGVNSGLYNGVMTLPDMSGWLARQIGLVKPGTPLPSQMVHDAGNRTRDSLGVDYTPNIVPETTGERIGFNVGDAAGQVASSVIPGSIVAKTAAAPVAGLKVGAPSYGQTVAQTLAANPALQLAGTTAGNLTTEFTGNPYLGLAASIATPAAANTAMRIPFAAPAKTGAEVERRALLADAKGEGILPSFGNIVDSGPARIFESVIGKLPFMGGQQTRLDDANKTAFNRAPFEKVPAVKGEGLDAATPGTVDQVKARIGRQFDSLENNTTVNIDPQFGRDIGKAKADFSQQLRSQMPESIVDKLDELQAAASTLQKPGVTAVTLDGETYKNIRSELSAQLSTAQGTDKTAIGAMIDALDGAVERSLPKDMVKDWRDARTSWRRISMIDDAVSARHNGETAAGNIPPGSLDARAAGDKNMARLAQVGVKFVGDKTPDSSTPARLFFQNAMGLGAGGMYAFPSTTAALVGSGYITNALLNNPYTGAALIDRLQRPREGLMSLPLAGVLAAQQGANDGR